VDDISFLHLEVFWAIPAGAIVVGIWLLIRRRRFLGFSAVRQLQSPLRRLPSLLVLLALLLTITALAKPVLTFTESSIEAQGLDIVLVVDLSSSMAETMGLHTEGTPTALSRIAGKPYATRLEVCKRALRDFIERRRADRIGLIVFSDEAYVISPLTFDYEYLLRYVDELDDTLMRTEGMTAIGEGMHLATVLLAKQSEPKVNNKVIVTLTDGEHNTGRDPLDVLEETSAAGIRTYLIGVDLEAAIKEKPAVASLIATVRRQGGRYYQANSIQQLQAANADLSVLEKGRLAGKEFQRNVPIFTWCLMPAVVLIVCALACRAIPYFVDLT
jgi:Ca-activated chloride channel family protein